METVFCRVYVRVRADSADAAFVCAYTCLADMLREHAPADSAASVKSLEQLYLHSTDGHWRLTAMLEFQAEPDSDCPEWLQLLPSKIAENGVSRIELEVPPGKMKKGAKPKQKG